MAGYRFSRESFENPLSINYIKILQVSLTISASWPYEAFQKIHPFYRVYRYFVVAWALLAITGDIYFLVDDFQQLTFFELGHIYVTIFFSILSFVRTLLPFFNKYGVIMKQFLTSFHLIHHKHKGQHYQEVHAKIERLSYRLVLTTSVLAMICAISFNMMPIINNISTGAYHDANKSVELAAYFSYPGFDPQDHIVFITAWNSFLIFACAILVGGIDCVILLFVFQIIGHIDILKYNLISFPEPVNSKIIENCGVNRKPEFTPVAVYTNEENLIIKERLKECIQHHLLIINFTDSLSQLFGPVMAVYYVFHLVTGCLMLLELSSAGDAATLTRYGPVTTVIFGQLIVLSMVFELVNTKSEELSNVVYELSWESMDVSNQRSICVLLHRLQTPVLVKAFGVTPVNVQTMVSILKTSFSYFTFLKSFND